VKKLAREIGERVGAILSATSEGVVNFLGYGTYDGEHVPPPDVCPDRHELKITNPRITLDSGETVWGMQCWWGSEEGIRKQIELYDIVNVVEVVS